MSSPTPVRLLVVDDEIAIRLSLESFLSDAGMAVTSVASVRSAQAAIVEQSYDLAIVDLRLPDASGETFISGAHTLYPDMKFIIYTGSVDYQLSPAMRKIGLQAEHIIIKPVDDLQVIVARVRALLEQQ